MNATATKPFSPSNPVNNFLRHWHDDLDHAENHLVSELPTSEAYTELPRKAQVFDLLDWFLCSAIPTFLMNGGPRLRNHAFRFQAIPGYRSFAKLHAIHRQIQEAASSLSGLEAWCPNELVCLLVSRSLRRSGFDAALTVVLHGVKRDEEVQCAIDHAANRVREALVDAVAKNEATPARYGASGYPSAGGGPQVGAEGHSARRRPFSRCHVSPDAEPQPNCRRLTAAFF